MMVMMIMMEKKKIYIYDYDDDDYDDDDYDDDDGDDDDDDEDDRDDDDADGLLSAGRCLERETIALVRMLEDEDEDEDEGDAVPRSPPLITCRIYRVMFYSMRCKGGDSA